MNENTQKALDLAIEALNTIATKSYNSDEMECETYEELANAAEITAWGALTKIGMIISGETE